jgi:hypothetical protein
LTKKAQAIKDRLTPGASLKGILSVGLEIFDLLPQDEQAKRVRMALIEDVAEKMVRDSVESAAGKKRRRGRPPRESA